MDALKSGKVHKLWSWRSGQMTLADECATGPFTSIQQVKLTC